MSELSPLPNLEAICSPSANDLSIFTFIMQASISKTIREYVLSQRGSVAKNLLNMLHRRLQAIKLQDPTRRQILYLLRSLAFHSSQFPDGMLLKADSVMYDFTTPMKATGFANIYLGMYRKTAVAVKEIKLIKSEQYYIYREASTWAQLSHPNIARMLGIIFDPSKPGLPLLVSRWMQHGTLHDYIRTDHFVQHKRRRPLAQQIAEALAYLHGQKTCHGDVKDTNILIDDKYNALLTDFGLSTVGDITLGHFTGTSVRGSKAWMSPERFNPDIKNRTAAMDVYAYGLICYMLAKGEPIFAPKDPRSDPDGEEVARRVRAGERPPRFNKCYDGSMLESDFWQLIIFCWDAFPQRRLSMQNVLAYFDVQCLLQLSDLDTAQFTALSWVTRAKTAEEPLMLGLKRGETLGITDWMSEKWTARRYNGEVGHVLPNEIYDVTQFWATVIRPPDNDANPTKMRRLAVTVGEVVAVVAITPSWWLVRNLTKVMGVIEPGCLQPFWPEFTPPMAPVPAISLFPYTPMNCPHAVPLKTAIQVLTLSHHVNDPWRVVRYTPKGQDEVVGIVPAHYLEPVNKRPRLLEDVKIFDSRKKKGK